MQASTQSAGAVPGRRRVRDAVHRVNRSLGSPACGSGEFRFTGCRPCRART